MDLHLGARQAAAADEERERGNRQFRVQRGGIAHKENSEEHRGNRIYPARQEHNAHDTGQSHAALPLRRAGQACAEDNVLLRIGGDEFVIFTAEPGMDHADEIVSKIAAQNEKKITFGGTEITVNIHAGAFRRAENAPAGAENLVSEINERIRTIHN